MEEIIRLCDLHVAFFGDALAPGELRGVPRGHPLDMLMRENEELLKRAEALALLLAALAEDGVELHKAVEAAHSLYRLARIHYQKLQMTLFPYLEQFDIVAVPRILWARGTALWAG